ncbi:MAG: DUF4302 domain-containing protein [Bacteroidota bacterium]
MIKRIFIGLMSLVLFSCTQDDAGNVPSVDERFETAVNELKEKLMEPSNGWLLNYSPTPTSGSYLILLDFSEDVVRIQSDLPGDDGYFYDQTIPYRIDAQLDLELIFETYAVFHFLFEQNQSTFGGEFEFLFLEDVQGTLLFQSKSDFTNDVTTVSFLEASSESDAAFSPEIPENMQAFDSLSSLLFSNDIFQQVYLEGLNVSVFWELDQVARTIKLDLIGQGASADEIVANDNYQRFDDLIGYTFANGQMILDDPFTFNLEGASGTFSAFEAENFAINGEDLCGIGSSAVYSGTATDLGSVVITRTFFQSGGFDFIERDQSYSVNIIGVIDQGGSLTREDAVIGQNYPDAEAFVFNFGVSADENENEPTYGAGIVFSDEDNISQQHMRGFDMTTVQGNTLEITLNDDFFYNRQQADTLVSETALRTVTDEIFSGGTFYVTLIDEDIEDLVLYKLRNPCTGYEIALLEPNSN